MGYVGLPPAFAEARLSVLGIERDPERVTAIEGGDSYAEDVPSRHLGPLVSSGRLRATGDYGPDPPHPA